MRNCARQAASRVALVVAMGLPAGAAFAQQTDQAAVIRQVDAAVAARFDHVLGFTDIEHYAVFRGNDETHPVAEMTVRDTYRKGAGKEYTALSESGSSIVLRLGLKPLLDNEMKINQPGNVEKSWFTSANYKMTLKPGGTKKITGRDCFALSITARHRAPNLIDGTLWVDARNGMIVRIDGIAASRATLFAAPAHMVRDYIDLSGFPMAVHARAESNSIVGRIVVTIEYSDYHLQLQARK